MNHYTVLLLRPDCIASDFGHDTYLAHVTAGSVEAAMRNARVEASNADGEGMEPEDSNPNDYYVLFVCRGHQEDLSAT